MIKNKTEDDLEDTFELLEYKRRDIANDCWEEERAHKYSDYKFKNKESPLTKIIGYIMRRVLGRYRCRNCHKVINTKQLKELKHLKDIRNFLRKNTK